MERTTITLGEIIENNVNIFDFDNPFYSEEYRPTFERQFIEHFYVDEIGQETIAKFKQRLKIKFNLIMPYWNKIFLADELEQRILDKLQQQKTDLKNELLTYLGINNNNNVKKERMVVDEVNANNEYTSINLDLMFDLRKRACKEINEKFGLNISVKKREVEENGKNDIDTRGDNREWC